MSRTGPRRDEGPVHVPSVSSDGVAIRPAVRFRTVGILQRLPTCPDRGGFRLLPRDHMHLQLALYFWWPSAFWWPPPCRQRDRPCSSGNAVFDRIAPAPVGGGFAQEDHWVWGSSVVKGDDGKFHMFVSRWPKAYPVPPGVDGGVGDRALRVGHGRRALHVRGRGPGGPGGAVLGWSFVPQPAGGQARGHLRDVLHGLDPSLRRSSTTRPP